MTESHQEYLRKLTLYEREIRFGRAASMETERAGVFHIGSVEEIEEVLAQVLFTSQVHEEQLFSKLNTRLIREVQLCDFDDLQCFKQLEISTTEHLKRKKHQGPTTV